MGCPEVSHQGGEGTPVVADDKAANAPVGSSRSVTSKINFRKRPELESIEGSEQRGVSSQELQVLDQHTYLQRAGLGEPPGF